ARPARAPVWISDMRAWLTVLGLLALLAAGCARAAGHPSAGVPLGSAASSLRVGGVERTFRAYRPARLARPAPLVVVLHGGFGSGAQAERSYGWDAAADRGRFLVAYPDGLDRAWNTEGGC